MRAEEGVKALSPTANSVFRILKGARWTVADLSEETGKTKDTVRQALSELRAAGLIDSEGPSGKPHAYWRRDEPTCDPYIDSQVGPNAVALPASDTTTSDARRWPGCGGPTCHDHGVCMVCQAESLGALRL